MPGTGVVRDRNNRLASEQMAAGIAPRLAAFARTQSFEAIPAEVRERAKYLILDAVGIAFASSTYDFARRTSAAVQRLAGDGASPILAHPMRLPPRDAAMLNGFLVHGLDYDDTHSVGIIHATASTLPCALAAAVSENAAGRELLAAYIVGVEAAVRLAAVAKGGFHQAGFHPTGVIGAFACALVAGRLMGLDAGALAMAQGIALSMASGSFAFLEDGAWTKRLHPGWAALSGLTAAGLARAGFVGASAPYEGRFGLYNSYLGPTRAEGADLDLAIAGLGTHWEVMNVAIKPFPACHFTHACIDAAIALACDHDLEPRDITKVRARVPADVVNVVCEPIANKRRPANSYDAQFSIPYLAAAGLARRRFTLAELDDSALGDRDILALAGKVDYEIDAEAEFPKYYSGELIVTTGDGRELRHREHVNRGGADRPVSNSAVAEKFIANIRLAVSPERAAAVRDAVLGLDEGDARRFGDALAA